MSRTVLVLASTGTTGREVVRALQQRGATVRAATRSPAAASFPEAVTLVPFDLEDARTWGPALAGVDAVYFALPAFRPDEVELGTAILAAAVEAGVSRVVKLSAMGVDANPESGHRRLELAIEATGLPYVHLRPTFFMDNFVNFWGAGIAQAGVIALPAADGRSGFVAAADIGDAAAEALLGDAAGEVWTLTGPESLNHDEIAARIGAVLGREVRYVDVTPEDFAATLASHGTPPLGVQMMGMLYEMVRAGWTAPLSDDLAAHLDRAPTRFDDWAADHAAAWRA
jgi:uncharacterized protein YbjT (DUF2867 family)